MRDRKNERERDESRQRGTVVKYRETERQKMVGTERQIMTERDRYTDRRTERKKRVSMRVSGRWKENDEK